MAKHNVEFDYFHGYESEQFAFYRIPKVLFTDDYFKDLSSDAKVLYGLMLDRMSLSIKNNWIDEEDRVYIIFTLEQVMQYMNCGKDKGVKILAELDTGKGIGLIERVKRGLGKPAIIYVKSFLIKDRQECMESADEKENCGSAEENQEAEVKTDVIGFRCFPLNVRIICIGSQCIDITVSPRNTGSQRRRLGIFCLISIATVNTDILLTCLSPTQTEFQTGNRCIRFFQEIFFGDIPCKSSRRKQPPTVALGETGRSIVTQRYRKQVF